MSASSLLGPYSYNQTGTSGTFTGVGLPYYILPFGATGVFAAQIRLPRGATIQSIQGLFAATGGQVIPGPTVKKYTYSTSGPGSSVSCSGGPAATISVSASPAFAWYDIGILSSGTVSSGLSTDGESSVLYINWGVSSTSDLAFAGWRVTYTFSDIDFMV
jgi:hypothetical protein